MPKQAFHHAFRMRQLPKAEYQLMKEMIDCFGLDDPSELFTALLRLGAETQQLTGAVIVDGSLWLRRIITETVSELRQPPSAG